MDSAWRRERTSIWQGKYGEKLTEQNVESCYISSVLQNDGEFKEACFKFVCEILRVENCIRFLNFGKDIICDNELVTTVRDFILKHIEEVKSRREFLDLVPGMIDSLLVPVITTPGKDDGEPQLLDYSLSALFLSLYEWMSDKRHERLIKFGQIVEQFPLDLVQSDALKKVTGDKDVQRYPKVLTVFLSALLENRKNQPCSSTQGEVMLGAEMEAATTTNVARKQSGPKVEAVSTSTLESDNEGDVSEHETSVSEAEESGLSDAGSTAGDFEIPPTQESDDDDVMILDEYDPTPTEWLAEVLPKVHPYFPQIGDDLVYFRQGHKRYIQEVARTGAYAITSDHIDSLPYVEDSDLPAEVLVKLNKIIFKNYPPRVAILELERINWKSKQPTGDSFSVHYHYIPNVTDFLVLKQVYDYSLERRWKNGDRFRSLHSNTCTWRMGKIIEANAPYQPSFFPDSNYLSLLVAWDDYGICKRREPLSPWELFPIKNGLAKTRAKSYSEQNTGAAVCREELLAIMNEILPRKSEWQDKESRRISSLMDFILKRPSAKRFLSPEFNPLINYPMNLSIIKARLDNLFYRSKEAILTDSDQLARNFPQCYPPDVAKRINVFSRLIREFVSDVRMTPESVKVRYSLLCDEEGVIPGLGESNINVAGVSNRRMDGTRPGPARYSLAEGAVSSSKRFKGNSRKVRVTPRARLNPFVDLSKSITLSSDCSSIRARNSSNLQDSNKEGLKKKQAVSSKGQCYYECKFCDYGSTRSNSVKEHERLHTGEKSTGRGGVCVLTRKTVK